MKLYSERTGNELRLQKQVGRGGEGSVWSVEGRPDQVAKLYRDPPDAEKVGKLTTMARTADAQLVKVAAWPLDLLVDAEQRVQGFMMPFVTAHRDAHELYSPKSRSESFRDADYRFLVRVGANIARVVGIIHSKGHVIGDINHGNFLIAADGTVTAIDCDSFQIRHPSNQYTCDVGVPLFTPPELQGYSLRGVVRAPAQDYFGLAVLLFHLLFMGRHPFAGRYLGLGDMPIEQAIAERRFAYAPDARLRQMESPPNAISLSTMGERLSALFVNAFTGFPGARPNPSVWIDGLRQLENNLQPCRLSPSHYFPTANPACPWCPIENATGIRLFGQRVAIKPFDGAFNVEELLRSIAGVAHPSPDPPLPSSQGWSPTLEVATVFGRNARATLSASLVLAGLVACSATGGDLWSFSLPFIAAYFLWQWEPPEKAAAYRDYLEASKEFQSLEKRWSMEAAGSRFAERKATLQEAAQEFKELPDLRKRLISQLEAEKIQRQNYRYLDRFRIEKASINGFGPGRKSMLAAYGIETAADVKEVLVLQIPGFGSHLTAQLLGWKRGHERNFRANPAAPIDPSDLAEMEAKLARRRRELIAYVQGGPQELERLRRDIEAARRRLLPSFDEALKRMKIAELLHKRL